MFSIIFHHFSHQFLPGIAFRRLQARRAGGAPRRRGQRREHLGAAEAPRLRRGGQGCQGRLRLEKWVGQDDIINGYSWLLMITVIVINGY